MEEKYNFNSMIPWHVLRGHLERLAHGTYKDWLKSKDHDEQLRVQGKGLMIEQLKNLPETLKLSLEDDKDARTYEKREGQENAA